MPWDIHFEPSRAALYDKEHCPNGNPFTSKIDFKVVFAILTYLTDRKSLKHYEKSVNNFAITKSIYKNKNNSKFKNKLKKAITNCEKLLLIYF